MIENPRQTEGAASPVRYGPSYPESVSFAGQRKPPPPSPFIQLRITVSRAFTRATWLAARVPAGAAAIRLLRSIPVLGAILRYAAGYRNVYGSMREAREFSSGFLPVGAEHPDAIATTVAISRTARPSDYPVFFHIGSLWSQPVKVFDLGGGVGSLFYSYERYVPFSPHLRWFVYELPGVIENGQRIAADRGEQRLQFTTRMEDAEETDVFLASGSIHFFEQPIAELIGGLKTLPRHVIINRTPLIHGGPVYTTQDGGSYIIVCKLWDRDVVVTGLEELGYELVDSWTEYKNLEVPLYPEFSLRSYHGFYFRLKASNRDHDHTQSAGGTIETSKDRS